MNTGTLQRHWSVQKPQVFDRKNRLVRMDIISQKGKPDGSEDAEELDGWSYVEVQIDRLMEYGHIKSQLIEAGFAQKDEFGLLMNAVGDIIDAAMDADSWESFRDALSTDDIQQMRDFTAYRAMCAQAAKDVLKVL